MHVNEWSRFQAYAKATKIRVYRLQRVVRIAFFDKEVRVTYYACITPIFSHTSLSHQLLTIQNNVLLSDCRNSITVFAADPARSWAKRTKFHIVLISADWTLVCRSRTLENADFRAYSLMHLTLIRHGTRNRIEMDAVWGPHVATVAPKSPLHSAILITLTPSKKLYDMLREREVRVFRRG